MRYCKRCVQPDTRPSIKFDKDGVCPACRYSQKWSKIDWAARRRKLDRIAAWGKKHNFTGYDCIVAVSGGKDSTRQSMYVRDELGLKPLLVCCSYPPEQVVDRGVKNLSNLISLGFDCISISPSPIVWKKMMRQGFLKHGNWAKSTEMALYASAPRIAIAYHIPLIFLGENPALMLGHLDAGSLTENANRMKYSFTLAGGPKSLATPDISEIDLYWYHYPSDKDMQRTKLRVVYLGYFIRDFTRFKNALFSIANGLTIRTDPPEDIGDNYGFEALDEDFVVVNQMIKHLKYGFGKVTDQVCEAIRLEMITRDQAVDLVKKYDGKYAPRYITQFCKYIGIPEKKFWELAESFRNRDIWEKTKNGELKLKYQL